MSEWKRVKLGDCIKEINEKTTRNNQYKVLSVTKDGIFSQEEFFKKQIASANNIGYKIIRKNNLVFSTMNLWMGSLDVLTNYDIGIVSPAYKIFEFNEKLMLPEYGKYFMKSYYMLEQYKNCSEQGASVVRRNLDLKALLNVEINIPTIEEQEKIVKILKNIDSIIEKYESLLEEKKQFIKSQFVEMFDKDIYEVVKLNDVCDVRDGTHDSPSYLSYSPYKFITSKNLVDGKISFEDVKYIKKKDYDKFNERSKVNYGDILMPMIGTIGNPVIVNIENERIDFAIKNVALIKFYKGTKVNNIYIKSLLMSDSFNRVLKLTKKGGTQQFIALKDIRNFNIKLPPIKLQNLFAEIVEQIDKQKFLLEQQKHNYEKLKKGLMQKLLTGKIRVKI